MLLRAGLALLLLGCAARCFAEDDNEGPTAAALCAAPGATTEVAFRGVPSGEPLAFWSTFPADATALKSSGGAARFRLSLPANCPVGVGAVRVATTGGVSDLQLFMVDDLPDVSAKAGTSPQTAAPISFPCCVDGACDPLASAFYRFTATAGQRVSIEVVARRLNSPLDPIVRLLDSAGRELAWCDDTPGIGADCRLAHTFAAAGEYVIELRDANYDGGPDYHYHLRLGDFPLANAPFPLAVKRGATAMLHFDGIPEAVQVDVPRDATRFPVSLRRPGGAGSGFAYVLATDEGDLVVTGSHSAAQPAKVTLPITISGCLSQLRARHYYAIDGKKGDRLTLIARSRTVGGACDVAVTLIGPDGKRVAEVKPPPDPKAKDKAPSAPPEDAPIEYAIADAGTYRLQAEDLNHRGGPGMIYRLELSRASAGFDLAVDADKLEAAVGGTAKVTVKAIRHDYAGPIRLSLGEAARGLSGEATIPADKNEVQLTIAVARDVPANKLLALSIVGETRIGDVDVARTASTAAVLKKLFPRVVSPMPDLEGSIGLLVRPAPATTRSTTRPRGSGG